MQCCSPQKRSSLPVCCCPTHALLCSRTCCRCCCCCCCCCCWRRSTQPLWHQQHASSCTIHLLLCQSSVAMRQGWLPLRALHSAVDVAIEDASILLTSQAAAELACVVVLDGPHDAQGASHADEGCDEAEPAGAAQPSQAASGRGCRCCISVQCARAKTALTGDSAFKDSQSSELMQDGVPGADAGRRRQAVSQREERTCRRTA